MFSSIYHTLSFVFIYLIIKIFTFFLRRFFISMKRKTKNNKSKKQEKDVKIIATLGKNGWIQIPEL